MSADTSASRPERSFRGLFWALVLVGVLLDQGSKYVVFRWLSHDGPGETRYPVVGGAFELLTQYTREQDAGTSWFSPLRTWSSPFLPRVNHGALFGVGGEYVYIANGIFAGVSVAAAIAILIWSTRPSTARDVLLCASIGLILAGTLGNLYDRVVFLGVRDFLHWFYAFEWPVFNIADCCLVVGATLLLVQAFWTQPALESASNTAAATSLAPSVESSV